VKNLVLIFLLLSTPVMALKVTHLELVARANDYDSFQLPFPSYLSNVSPVINDRGDISFNFVTYENEKLEKGVWLRKGSEKIGKSVFRIFGDKYLSVPALNNRGNLAFNLYDTTASDGIFKYDSVLDNVSLILDPEDLPYKQYSYISLNEQDELLFRGRSHRGTHSVVFYNETDGDRRIFREGNSRTASKISYIFGSRFNNQGMIAGKVRLGERGEYDESQGDEIRVWDLEGKMTTIASDQDVDKNSLFKGFFNSVALSDNGHVVFVAKLAHKVRALYVSHGGKLTRIATEGEDGLKTLEQFSPVVNANGDIAFRGINQEGKRKIFFARRGVVTALIGEDDIVTTDRETGRIQLKKGFPGLSGGISMNSSGDIVFNCILKDKYGKNSLGNAIYLIRVGE